MKQIELFEKDHLLLVKERFEQSNAFEPGKRCYIADNGAKQCIIKNVETENGEMLYECYTDTATPIRFFATKEELYSSKDKKACEEKWNEMEKHFEKISPNAIGVEYFVAYDLCFPRPYKNKRTGKTIFAVLSNQMVYIEPFGEPARLEEHEEPYAYVDTLAEEFLAFAKEKKAMVLNACSVSLKDVYKVNKKFVSWEAIQFEVNLRDLRTK